MILLERRGNRYRCPVAFLADLEDNRKATVSSRGEVVKFLQKHPDQYFFLTSDASVEALSGEVDEQKVIYCGMLRWSSKRQTVEADPFKKADR
jgi:hypothetical protein